LDDLIVASPLANQSLGKSYVIFGKIDSSAINLSAIGTGGLDWLEKHQQLNHPSHLRLHRLQWKLNSHSIPFHSHR
jgi:hypothetical protein